MTVLSFGIALLLASQYGGDHHRLNDDHADRNEIIKIGRSWQRAVARGDRSREHRADARLAHWIRQELGESQREVADAERETRQSYSRREYRDDRRDLAAAKRDAQQIRTISFELQRLQPYFASGRATQREYAQKRNLITRLIKSAQREVKRSQRELREPDQFSRRY